MNGLIVFTIGLLILFTGLGIHTFLAERRETEELARKAEASGIVADEFDN